MESILSRINQLAHNEGITITALEQRIGASKGVLSRALKNNTDIQSKWLVKINEQFPEYNIAWLISGAECMLQEADTRQVSRIPLYMDMDEVHYLEEPGMLSYIDPGDWFPAATAAMLYYNTCMKEYPSGCMIILRRRPGLDDLVWGEHYLIEYADNMLLRELQPAEDALSIYAYATNETTYADGRYKFPPVQIRKQDIRNIYLVLGYISKRQDNGAI